MADRDGCGMMKLGTTSVYMNFQLKDGVHLSKLDLSLAVHTSSLKGVAFPFSLGAWADPCKNKDSHLECPLNKGQNHVYTVKFAIDINYMLSLMIPSTETLDAIFSIEGTDLYTGKTKKLGNVNHFYLAMMDMKEKAVKEGLVKTTQLTGETACHDIDRLTKVPSVTDKSSSRISFLKLHRNSDRQATAYFIVTEGAKRRSFGVPELVVSLSSSQNKLIKVPNLNDGEKYPCGLPAAKTTCQFSTLKQLNSKRPEQGERAIRQYKVDFLTAADKISATLPDNADTSDYNVTYTLQGAHSRAFAKITLPLSDIMSKVEPKPKNVVPVERESRIKKKKFSREPLWKYDLENYSAEKLLAAAENSANKAVSAFSVVFVFISYLVML